VPSLLCQPVVLLLLSAGAAGAAGASLTLPVIEQQIERLEKERQSLPGHPAPQAAESVGFHSQFVGTTQAARWVQVDLGTSQSFDSVVLVPAWFPSSSDGSGAYGMPPRFRVDVSDEPDFATYQTLADHTDEDFPASLSPVFVPASGSKGRFVRFTATRLVLQRLSRGFFCLGELLVFNGPLNIASRCTVTSSGANETQPAWSLANLTDGVTCLGPPVEPGAQHINGWHSAIANKADLTKWVQVDLTTPRPADELRLYPAHPTDFPERPGFGFPVRFRVEASDDPQFANPKLVFDAAASDYVNPADNAVIILAHGLAARYWRITATKLWERSKDYVFALGELEAWSKGTNVAPGAQVTSLDETRTPAWQAAMLVDGRTSLGQIVSWPDWLRGLSRRHDLDLQLAALQRSRESLVAARQRQWWLFGGIGALLAVILAVALHLRQRAQQRRSLAALRRQIARDLHDEIGSSLGSISLISELAMKDGDTSAFQEVHRLSREAAESMRGIIWLVRETGTPTLQRLLETMRQTAGSLLGGVQWELVAPEDGPVVSPPLDFHRHLFLFFKEAVHNIARHAQAKKVDMEMTWTARSLRLSIQDDGAGFDTSAPASGSGLANLRHRAEAVRGTLQVTSHPGQGTCIVLEASFA
jgi:signal transduction histidine kinase